MTPPNPLPRIATPGTGISGVVTPGGAVGMTLPRIATPGIGISGVQSTVMTPPNPLSRSTPRPPRTMPTAAALLAAAVLAACTGGGPRPAPGPEPDFQPTTTVEELMRAVIDPAADAVWDAVVITSTLAGVERQVPDGDDDWLALEHHAVRLLEAGNLLQIEGRPVAAADSVSELPGIDLEPADIAIRRAEQYDAWLRSARELHDAGVVVLNAARARSVDALLESGDRLDAACETCHSRFWYPPDAADAADAGSASPSRAP